MGFIEQLFNGELFPNETIRHTDNVEWKACHMEIKEVEQKLLVKLTQEERELYQQLKNLQIQKDFLENRSMFIHGFRIGSQMLIDVFKKK